MSGEGKRFPHTVLAMVYDFDGTLTPLPMQEYTVLPRLGVSGARFWQEVNRMAEAEGAEPMLAYLRHLVDTMEAGRAHLTRADLSALAVNIRFFPGVGEWFARMTDYVHVKSYGRVSLLHYVISAGLKEILDGTAIRPFLHRVFASEFFFNHHGAAVWPKVVVTDTVKTQYLFRINKGREEIAQSINEYMPENKRPIPFTNMVYIGDGLTDVPSMTVTRKNGGHAVAVHRPRHRRSMEICRMLLAGDRVDFFALADYREGSSLDRRVKLILDLMVARVLYEKEAFSCRRKMAAHEQLQDMP